MVTYHPKGRRGRYNQNDGVPGVVYVLKNDAFKELWLKIGCSRHSGHVRARDMNKDASTGLPAHHICVYECRTLDCGNAEKLVFKELNSYRKGRQEFFEVDIEVAKRVIERVCRDLDDAVRIAQAQAQQATREAAVREEAEARRKNAEFLRAAELRREQELAQSRRNLEAAQKIEGERQRLDRIRRDRVEEKRQANLTDVDMTCQFEQRPITTSRPKAGRFFKFDLAVGVIVVALIALILSNKETSSTQAIASAPSQSAQNPAEPPAAIQLPITHPNAEETRAIVIAHPDAKEVIESASFSRWLEKNDKWRLIAKDGTASQIIDMFTAYKAEQRPVLAIQAARPSNSRSPAVPAKDRAAVQAALDRSYVQYPYLQSPDGVEAMRLIRARADMLMMKRGYLFEEAFAEAVKNIAPKFEPVWYKPGPLPSSEVSAQLQVEARQQTETRVKERPCHVASGAGMLLRLECEK